MAALHKSLMNLETTKARESMAQRRAAEMPMEKTQGRSTMRRSMANKYQWPPAVVTQATLRPSMKGFTSAYL